MMNLFFNTFISGISQIFIFTLIPFIWWFISSRKEENFIRWIGLKLPEMKKNSWFWIIGTSIVFMLISILVIYFFKGVDLATSNFEGLGIKALPSIFIYAVFNTAFSEELLFRGFLLKRLSNKFGFSVANILQASLFGILHGAMLISSVGITRTILIILFTGSIGWFMGYVNEKKANGSIIPSWIIHSIANIFSGISSAFLLI